MAASKEKVAMLANALAAVRRHQASRDAEDRKKAAVTLKRYVKSLFKDYIGRDPTKAEWKGLTMWFEEEGEDDE